VTDTQLRHLGTSDQILTKSANEQGRKYGMWWQTQTIHINSETLW